MSRARSTWRAAATLPACCLLALAAGCGGKAAEPEGLAIGAVDDRARSEPALVMAALERLGMTALRLTSIWAPGATAPSEEELAGLRAAVDAAAEQDVRVFLSVYHAGSATTPLTDEARSQFAAYCAAVLEALPHVRDLIVGNEPNLNRFWLPQFGEDGEDVASGAYLELLAAVHDAVPAEVVVWGGALAPRGNDRPEGRRHTQSPVRFVEGMGEAFRASGREEPPLDGFAFHPYPPFPTAPVDRPHPNTNELGLGDHERLRALLRDAFGRDLPLLYSEFGVETAVPPEEAGAYTGREIVQPVTPAEQADAYRRALEVAACLEGLEALLFFLTHDEPRLEGWQSGLYYADGSPKPSLEPVAEAIRTVECAG